MQRSVIMFKVERNEIFYVYKKVERDYVEAFLPHTDKSLLLEHVINYYYYYQPNQPLAVVFSLVIQSTIIP